MWLQICRWLFIRSTVLSPILFCTTTSSLAHFRLLVHILLTTSTALSWLHIVCLGWQQLQVLVLERSDRRLPPVPSAPVDSYRPLIALLGGSRRLSGLLGSGPSPSSPFPSLLGNLSRYQNWLDGLRFAAILSVWTFGGPTRASSVNQETPASAWRKHC